MNPLFSLSNRDLDDMTPNRAVRFFRDLIWAECRRVGLPVSAANISSWITVPDGGVDASIKRSSTEPESELVQNGFTAYQIKAGASFEPWQDAEVKKELFGKKAASRENLGESVRRCLEQSGRYFLVCFGVDPVEQQCIKVVKNLTGLFKKCGFDDPDVSVWGQNKLIGLFQQYPSIVLAIKGMDLGSLQSHKSWVENEDMCKDLEKTADYDAKCDALRDTLRTSDQAHHIRVVEEAGSGKTRFVLEATRADDLAPLVLYGESPRACDTLLSALCLEDNDSHVILIVDECDQKQSDRLWNRLRNRGARIKLITIHNLPEPNQTGIERADLPALGPDQIKAILRQYVAPHADVNRWAALAGSSPRFAHLIGDNLKNHPENPLQGTEYIFDRIVAGSDEPGSEKVRRRRCVLRYLALFSRFGYEEPVAAEGQAIAELIKTADGISDAQLRECVKWFRNSKIIQGDRTLYITPKALHIQMWREYWEHYGDGLDVDAFLAKLQGNHEALTWFFDMFKYAALSETASRVVRRLLGSGGPFEHRGLIRSEVGGSFFLAMTEADPHQALECLKRTIGTWSRKELREFDAGRQRIVWALERMAVWKDLFADSARLLMALGEEENATNANNASGVFAGLFSLATGRVAPTEATPSERLPVLVEALESTGKERRLLGLKACRAALEHYGAGRFIGAEFQGLREEAQLWTPKTYGELSVEIRKVWDLLVTRLDSLPDDEQREALNILFESSYELNFMESLARIVLETFEALADKPYVVQRELLRVSLEIKRRILEKAPPDIKARWGTFCERLTGSGFAAELRRYVGMDILEDEYDKGGKRTDELDQRIASLADHTMADMSLLEPELAWLVKEQANNAYRFGYQVGLRDTERAAVPRLLASQHEAREEGTTAFFGGYLRATFERDRAGWEAVLDRIDNDPVLRPLLAELVQRSGMSNRAGQLILAAVKARHIPVVALRMFEFGKRLDSLSDELFDAWLEHLLSVETTEATHIAFALFSAFYQDERIQQLPEQRTREFLMHDSFFGKGAIKGIDTMLSHHWEVIAKAFIASYPTHAQDLARKILEHLHEDGTVASYYHSPAIKILNDIMRQDPEAGWSIVAEHIQLPHGDRTFHVQQWLCGMDRDGALPLFPPDVLLDWVAEDAEKRAGFLAYTTPKVLIHNTDTIGLSRELLVRYGERKEVQNALYARWMTETWWGSESEHYRDKKSELASAKEDETDQNVLAWIDETIRCLDRHIEDALIREEREIY